ncbi:hypothetical protein [Treponema sp.]|uniref:hypothetical protein n=1 Tax=Treponema sp. TaxID=166 RepID=UPI0025E27883|nr:hypothetical protein [Treponema sp.]MCR5218596.1 hypothetical protein [Treponema sp.]
MSELEYLNKRFDECQDKMQAAFGKNDACMAQFWANAGIGFLKRMARYTPEQLQKEHKEAA